MKKGKFIVIDGTDGSGKATQTKLLIRRLRKEGYRVKAIDFPRYYNNFFGKFVGECLAGEYGNFLAVNPYIASVIYAADRFESSGDIKKWIKAGNIVIADRYASSNQIHQGSKIKNKKDSRRFLEWLEKMEFEVFKIPRPDAIIYLDVPVSVTRKLLAGKEKTHKKRYLKGRKDVAESSGKHLEESRENAMKIIKKTNNWVKINCMKNNQLMGIQEIGDLVWARMKKIIN